MKSANTAGSLISTSPMSSSAFAAVGVMSLTSASAGLKGAFLGMAAAVFFVQTQEFVFFPLQRYGSPVLVNKADQALEGDDDVHSITLTPIIDEVQP